MPGPSVHPMLLAIAPEPLFLVLVNHQIDQYCPPMDYWFIQCLFLHCLVSSNHLAHVENGPSVHPTVPVDSILCVVYQTLRRLHRCSLLGIVGSSDDVIFLPFLSHHVVFLHLWGFGMSTKDILNNVVSPIDHVVMNYQNHS
jgi:hypothetical protein